MASAGKECCWSKCQESNNNPVTLGDPGCFLFPTRAHTHSSYSRLSFWVLAASSCSWGETAAPFGWGSEGGDMLHSLAGCRREQVNNINESSLYYSGTVRLRRFQMVQTLHSSNSFCSVFTSMKTGFKLSTFNQLHLCCSQCLKDSPQPVWVLQRSPFLSSRPQRGERHLQTSRSTAAAETEAASQFPYILMWSSQGQTFLCSLVLFIIIVSENAGCNIQRVSSEAPGIRTTTRRVSGVDLLEVWTGVKLRIQNTQSRKSHNPPSFVRKCSPSQLWPYGWTSC